MDQQIQNGEGQKNQGIQYRLQVEGKGQGALVLLLVLQYKEEIAAFIQVNPVKKGSAWLGKDRAKLASGSKPHKFGQFLLLFVP